MSENPNITTEIAALGQPSMSTVLRVPASLRFRLLQFAVENGIEDTASEKAEALAVSVILTRYFRLADSERFGQFFGEVR